MTAQRPPSSKRWRMAMVVLTVISAGMLGRRLAHGRHPHFAHSHSGDIIYHASEAIISTDEAHTVVQANPSAATMFGTTVHAMQGCPLSRFIAPLPTLASEGTLAIFGDGAGRTGRRATDYAVTGLHASGATFPLEGSVSSLMESGERINTIILRDVSARLQVQEKLSRSYAQLRQLSATLQTVREEERAHIARELHDDLGQLLASLRIDLTLLQNEALVRPASAHLMQGMEANLLTAIQSLRRLATNLRPRALDEGGLYFALQGLRDQFVERHAIACSVFADEAELRFDDAASTAIFRIVQEALTNIARHSAATNVLIHLYRLDGQLFISIADDGRGIAAADMEKAQSLGLVGMRERVWGMHGEISVSADDPPGTRIDILIPIPMPARVADAPESPAYAIVPEQQRGTSASS